MNVKEVMTPSLECLSSDETLQNAAKKMKERDIGALPILKDDSLAGFITDRDIVIRAIAENRDPASTQVADIMTENVITCTEDQDLKDAANLMEENQIRRLVVVGADKRPCGILAQADIARQDDTALAGEVVHEVSRSAS